jgi:hypothetical protein
MLPREYTLSQYGNEQYEELDISKNFGKPYKNTNFGKSHVIHVITEYSDK